MSREIPLTRGMVALVDDEDYEHLMQWKWHANPQGRDVFYAAHASSPDADGKRHHVLMHREILRVMPGEEIDHANHDTLDNRRSNIRRCTRSQNHANRRKRANCSSRFKGVHWHKGISRWQAQIRQGEAYQYLGCFDDEIDAALAYNAAAVEMFGAFALLNEFERSFP